MIDLMNQELSCWVSRGENVINTGLSVIIPAYNEAKRLPAYLGEVHDHLDGVGFVAYEVIVIDDGSEDETAEIVKSYAASWPQLQLIRHGKNQGKGASVRDGILAASCSLILFADADGATPIACEYSLRRAIEQGADIAVGSRLRKNHEPFVNRNFVRWLFGQCFAVIARLVVRISVVDPQCGFKMFRRDIGHHLFKLCQENGYLFDIYILGLAMKHNYSIVEEPVSWEDKSGSKVSIFRDGWSMIRGLLRVRHAIITATSLTLQAGHSGRM